MNIVITGSSGFVGSKIIDQWMDCGHHISAVDAMSSPHLRPSGSLRFIQADSTRPGDWQNSVSDADAVVNLIGKNIFTRWTDDAKQHIHDSRVLSTRNIVDALPHKTSATLINASAPAYYGHRGDDILDESQGPSQGNEFLAGVCAHWEAEALAARKKGARVVLARFGVILGGSGGALSQMIPAFRMFAGGPIGNGRQWFPWIQIDDLVGAIDFILKNSALDGPVNLCSPHPARNQDFAKALGAALRRPSFLKTPAFMVRMGAGEMGDLLLHSHRMVPSRLLEAGYEFKYPNLPEALAASIKKPESLSA